MCKWCLPVAWLAAGMEGQAIAMMHGGEASQNWLRQSARHARPSNSSEDRQRWGSCLPIGPVCFLEGPRLSRERTSYCGPAKAVPAEYLVLGAVVYVRLRTGSPLPKPAWPISTVRRQPSDLVALCQKRFRSHAQHFGEKK